MPSLIYLILGFVLLLGLADLWTRTLERAAEQSVPRPGRLYPVAGGVLHCVVSGGADLPVSGGPVVVLIHGIAGQLQHFTYAMVALLQPDYRVIAVDRPGCGYSTVPGDGVSLAEQARMIDELLAGLGVERAVVVGHSLGGAVALAMALNHPGRVAGLALLCPLTQVQSEVPDALKGLQISAGWLRRLLGATIAVPIARLTAARMLAQGFAPERCPDDFMVRAGAVLGLRPRAFVAACSDLVAIRSEMPGLVARYGAELRVPGGVLYGAEDDLLSPDLHGHSMAVHGLICEVLAGRGHMIPITAPQDCAEFVRRMAAKAV